jgi:hypothetical protein
VRVLLACHACRATHSPTLADRATICLIKVGIAVRLYNRCSRSGCADRKPEMTTNEPTPEGARPLPTFQNVAYRTESGVAVLGDSLKLLKEIPDASIDLIFTSPPFALRRKKAYGNEDAESYVPWFLEFAHEFKRVLKDSGSLVIDIGGSWNKGEPTKSLYHYRLLLALVDEVGLHLAQEVFWYNPARLPTPVEWVCITQEVLTSEPRFRELAEQAGFDFLPEPPSAAESVPCEDLEDTRTWEVRERHELVHKGDGQQGVLVHVALEGTDKGEHVI